MSWSPTLFTGSGPVGLPPISWTEKTIESSPFFVRRGGYWCRGDQFGRTNFWIFLSGLQKLEQRAKKFIELRGEYVEQIPSSIVVACFLPGRAKYLSAHPRKLFRPGNICDILNVTLRAYEYLMKLFARRVNKVSYHIPSFSCWW